MTDPHKKRWRVDVLYTNILRGTSDQVYSHQFRFRWMASLFAWINHGSNAFGFLCAEVRDQRALADELKKDKA